MAVVIGGAILGAIGEGAVALVPILGTAVTVGAVVGEVALIAASVGLSYVARALSGAPNANLGSAGKLQSGGVVPRSFVVGYGMTGGKLAYVNTWGKDGKTPNAYISMVIAVSDLPVHSLQGLIVNDSPATYGSGVPDGELGYAIPQFNQDGRDYLWVKFYDGTQAVPDDHLVSTFGSDPNFPYSSDRIGNGVAYAVVTALVNQKLFSGFPTFKFILNGVKFYDPRLDSTVSGGSGSHRFSDQTTWAFTQNPKVIEYNVLRGITYGGAWFYGLQNLAASRLPLSSWMDAMDACDLAVDNNEGGTEPQYRCGGEIAVNVPPVDASAELNKCCNGRLAEIGGTYKTICGAAGTPSFSFTDADLLTTDQQSFNQFPGLSSLINAITASFPDPDQGWEVSPAPGRYDDDLEADDGGRELVSDIQYNMVPFAEQVQRLMESAKNEARRFRKHTVPLPPSFWYAEPLDFASWTSDRNGYDTKTFRIDLATDQASLDMVLVITECDPADYDWTPGTDFIATVSGPLVIAHPAAQAIVGWDASGVEIDGDGGRAKPGIHLEWSTTDIDDVDGVLFQVRLTADSTLKLSAETTHSIELFQTGFVNISQNLSANTAYQVRGKYRPISARDTDWSGWLDVTTPDIRIAAIDIYDDAISRLQLSDDLKNLNDFVGASVKQLLGQLRNLSQTVAETGFGATSDMQQIRVSLRSATQNVVADYTQLITAATGPASAIVVQLTTLQALVDDADLATIAETLAALSSAQGSQADLIDDLTAVQDNFSASGLFRVGVATTLSGADATIGLSVAATGGGVSKSASLFINAMSDGTSQIVAEADKFIITDGTHTGTPFLFTGSTLFVASAVIPIITSDKLDVGVINVGTLIADNIIATHHITSNAVTESLYVSSGSSTFTASNAIVVDSGNLAGYDGYTIELIYIGSLTRQSGHSPNFTAQIVKQNSGGGSSANVGAAFGSGGSGVAAQVAAVAAAKDTINAASGQTYYRVKISQDDGTTFTTNAAALLMTIFKK